MRRDLVLRPLTLRMPVRPEAAHHWMLLRGTSGSLPAMLRDRWSSGRVIGRSSLMAWTQTKETAR